MDRVAAMRMPAIYQWPEEAEDGGFIGYGPNIIQISREISARLFAKVLLIEIDSIPANNESCGRRSHSRSRSKENQPAVRHHEQTTSAE
jgi:hypothetical protein